MTRLLLTVLPALLLSSVSALGQDAGNDLAFADNGYALIGWDPPGGVATDTAHGMAIQADGRIVLAGHSVIVPTPGSGHVVFGCTLTRLLPDGSLDTGFGDGGRVLLQFPAPVPIGIEVIQNSCAVRSVLIDDQGRIVVAAHRIISYRTDANGPLIRIPDHIGVARFTGAGLSDTAFAGSGRMQFSFSTEGYDQVHAQWLTVVAGANGRLFVVATVSPEHDTFGTTTATAVARLTANGALDSGYAGNGKHVLPKPSPDHAWIGAHAVLDAAGRILIAGFRTDLQTGQMWVGRLSADGVPDTGFVSISMRWYVLVPNLPDMSYAGATAVRLDPQGRILLAGTSLIGGQFSGQQITVARLRFQITPRLDPNFGSGGRVLIPISYAGQAVAGAGLDVAVDTQGRVVIAAMMGREIGGQSEHLFATARVDTHGALDAGYWPGGWRIVETDFMPPAPRQDLPAAHALAITPAGRILIGGTVRRGFQGAQPKDDFAVLALRGAPEADVIFGDGFQCQAGAPGC